METLSIVDPPIRLFLNSSEIESWIWKTLMCRNSLGSYYDDMSFNTNFYPISKSSPASILIRYRTRLPQHDGYCSDPGEDTGKETTELIQYKLSDYQLMELRPYIKRNQININIVKDLFDQKLNCQGGSGYCSYHGFIRVTSAKISYDSTSPIENLCLNAFNNDKEDKLTIDEYIAFYKWNKQNQINGWLHLLHFWKKI